jgi:hypothetical protein
VAHFSIAERQTIIDLELHIQYRRPSEIEMFSEAGKTGRFVPADIT